MVGHGWDGRRIVKAKIVLDAVEIDRPIEDVFDFLSEMENSPRWGRTQHTEQVSEGPLSVGTRFHETAPMEDGGLDKETVITGLEPPVSYSYASRYSNGFEERAYVRLEEVAGRTRVQPTAKIHLPGIPQEQELAVVAEMRQGVSRLLQNLKDCLEQAHT